MTQIPPIEVKLVADVDQLKAGLLKAEKQIENLKNGTERASTGMANFQKGINRVALAAGAAAAAVGAFALKVGKDAVQAAMEDQKSQTMLANALRNTTGASNAAIASVEKYITAQQKNLAVTDDELRPSLATLLNATRDVTQAQKLQAIALDVSAGTGRDLASVSLALARAANGNFNALTRLGVPLSDNIKKTKDLDGALKVLSETYGGAASARANTFAGRLAAVKIAFSETLETLGYELMPVLEDFLKFISSNLIPKLEEFIKVNKDQIVTSLKNFATFAANAATGLMKIFTVISNNMGAFKIFAALMTGLFVSTKVYAGIIAIKTAIDLLKAAFVRQAAAATAAGVATAFATGGASALAAAASLAVFATAAAGAYFALNNMTRGANEANDATKRLGGTVANHLKDLQALSDMAGTTPTVTPAPKGKSKTQKQIDQYKADLKKMYGEVSQITLDAYDKRDEAEATYQEKRADVLRDYKDKQKEIELSYQNELKDNQERFDEAKEAAQERRNKAEEAARKRNTETLISIANAYAAKETSLKAELHDKLAELERNYQDKQTDLRAKAEEKRLGIVKQSMDRLRSAFAAQTGYDLQEAFASKRTPAKLIKDLQAKLLGAKTLQENAAALAGMGYSQTFIEQVVKNGPKAGNAIAKALKAASPEATKELQSLYSDIETISETGLDKLAETLNQGGNLATRELRAAYAQVAVDLKNELAALYTDFQKATVEANAAYDKAIAEAKAKRDADTADALKELADAFAEAKIAYDEAIADAQKAFDKANLKAQKDRDTALLDAKTAYEKAILDAQTALEKSLNAIQDNMTKKLGMLRAQIITTINELSRLNTTVPGAYIPNIPTITSTLVPTTSATTGVTNNYTTKVEVNGYDLSDPNSTAQSLVAIAKYGQTVTVLGTDTSKKILTQAAK